MRPVLRVRCPWRDTQQRYGKWNSVYVRFQPWAAQGLWDGLLQAPVDPGLTDECLHRIDSITVGAHVSAAGGEGRLCECFWSIRRRHPMRAFPAKAAMAAPSGRAS
ncbi:transposase [Sandarakinorhabdus sp.]|uniref:transposase n=1 Tax=Sandarakinorhabdus sp. TaxID=1916663 RepID=UPI00334017FC